MHWENICGYLSSNGRVGRHPEIHKRISEKEIISITQEYSVEN